MNYNIETLTFKNQVVNLALPKNFSFAEKYSLYLVFDGNELLANQEHNILSNNSSNKVFVGLNSSNDALRFNNLATYHNATVKTLMTKHFPELAVSEDNYLGGQGQVYLDFIETELIPFLTQIKKIQIADFNLLGCSMGAYFSLQMLYLSSLTFKKVYLFSPSIWFNETILNDLKTKILNHNSSLITNLWVGLKEPKLFEKTIKTDYYQDAINIKTILTTRNITTNFFVAETGSHGFKWWIDFINNHQEIW